MVPFQLHGAFFACRAAFRLGTGLLIVAALGGCTFFTGYRPDFPDVFALVETADEALAAFKPPRILRLQDDMVVYDWSGKRTERIPGHYQYVRSRWPRRDGFFEYREVWVPESVRVYMCDARIIADPQGVIVYRTWRGNACENFVSELPAWYDRQQPGVRREVPRLVSPDSPQPVDAPAAVGPGGAKAGAGLEGRP